MEGNTMESQAEADQKRRFFKREVSYRSIRTSTQRAFTTFRKKVEDLSGPLGRRPLHQLHLNEDSPQARGARRLPPAPVKRSMASLFQSPTKVTHDNEQKTPARDVDSEMSDFGDSPALFDYVESPARRPNFPAAMRRSVRNLVARRGLVCEGTPGSAKRLIHKRQSKNLARRRIQEIASPKRCRSGVKSPGRSVAEVNELAQGLASLRSLNPNTTTP